MHVLDGANVKVATPYFICLAAKRQQTLDVDASKAQLLAQIRALQIQRFNFSYFFTKSEVTMLQGLARSPTA